MNQVWNRPMVPARTAAKMLIDELGNYHDWAIWLTESRRFKRRGKPPEIPFHRDADSHRVFYLLSDVQYFIAKSKAGKAA